MKNMLKGFAIICGFLITAQATAGVIYQIEKLNAKAIYDGLTKVQEEGAAGHTFKKGTNVLCWYINADMNDANGKLLPPKDPKRYYCSIYFDPNGVATPGKLFSPEN